MNSLLAGIDMSDELFDDEGFIIRLDDWNETVANIIAEHENIKLSDEHWAVIHSARNFYHQFDLSPEMRPLVKWIGQQLGKDKGNSLYLLKLFPQSPAKLVSKIAGLPKPLNCI